MNTNIDAAPAAVANDVAALIQKWQPSEADIRDLQERLLARHSELRLEPVVSSEEIVEGYFRCRLVDHLARQFALNAAAIPKCVNSSHKAVWRVCVAMREHRHLSILDEDWSDGWTAMKKECREVDIRVPGRRSARHADLHIVAQRQIVSLEFKYLAGRTLRDEKACIEQMRRHAEHHARALFIVYVPAGKRPDLTRITAGLSSNATLIAATGPTIAPADRRPR